MGEFGYDDIAKDRLPLTDEFVLISARADALYARGAFEKTPYR